MQVILLERVPKLGQMGETVRVRDGFARNFLLPRGKALRATEANKKRFENQRADLEARNLDRRTDAEKILGKLEGKTYTVIRQAGEAGQLYGSVSPRDIAETIGKSGVKLDRSQIALSNPIKALGLHPVPILLHPEVEVMVTVNVARSPEAHGTGARVSPPVVSARRFRGAHSSSTSSAPSSSDSSQR